MKDKQPEQPTLRRRALSTTTDPQSSLLPQIQRLFVDREQARDRRRQSLERAQQLKGDEKERELQRAEQEEFFMHEYDNRIQELSIKFHPPVSARPSKTGMTTEHTEIVQSFCQANDVISVWRPINSAALEKLAGRRIPSSSSSSSSSSSKSSSASSSQNQSKYTDCGRIIEQYKGKALNLKAKSSAFGPLCGDITGDSTFSKLAVDLWKAEQQQKTTQQDDEKKTETAPVKQKGPESSTKAPERTISSLEISEKITSLKKKIEHDTKKTADLIENAKCKIETFEKEMERAIDLDDLSVIIQKANDENLVVPIDKVIYDFAQPSLLAYKVYCIIEEPAKVLFHGDGKPRLVINIGSDLTPKYLEYDYKKENVPNAEEFEKFSQPFVLTQKQQLKPVQILAYRKWFIEKDANLSTKPDALAHPVLSATRILESAHGRKHETQVSRKDFPITSDYDGFATAPRKIFPLHNNPDIESKFSRKSFLSLTRGNLTPEVRLEIAIEAVGSFEAKQKMLLRNRSIYPAEGIVSEVERTTKIYLKGETDEACVHGDEAFNPNPEEINAPHSAFLPDGKIVILQNESEICKFYNTYREQGFPLWANAQWGWEIMPTDPQEESSSLTKGMLKKSRVSMKEIYIPQHKFNWKRIRDQIDAQKCEIRVLEGSICDILKNIPTDYSSLLREFLINYERKHEFTGKGLEQILQELEKNPSATKASLKLQLAEMRDMQQKLQMSLSQNADDEGLMQLFLQIENLKLEPDIVYSQEKAAYFDKKTGIDTAFRLAVEKNVRLRELKAREDHIEKLTQRFDEQAKAYSRAHNDQRSLIMSEFKKIKISRVADMESLKKLLVQPEEKAPTPPLNKIRAILRDYCYLLRYATAETLQNDIPILYDIKNCLQRRGIEIQSWGFFREIDARVCSSLPRFSKGPSFFQEHATRIKKHASRRQSTGVSDLFPEITPKKT